MAGGERQGAARVAPSWRSLDGAVVAVAAAIGAALVYLRVRHGVGVSPDSLAYLAMADRIADSPRAILRPGTAPIVSALNHWSPLTGVVLAATRGLGSDPYVRARWVSTVGGAVLAAATFAFARRHASRAVAVVAVAVVLVSPELLADLGSLNSEALYYPLLAVGLLAADLGLAGRTPRPRWIAVAGVAGLLATMARFVGLALPAGMVVASVALWRGPERRRATGAVVAFALVPTLVWYLAYGTDRRPAFDPQFGRIRQVVRSIARYVVPERLLAGPIGQAIGVVVAVAALAAATWWIVGLARRVVAGPLAGPDRPVLLLVATAVAYGGMVVLASTFYDPYIAFQPRVLFPTWLPAVLVVAVLAGARPTATSGARVITVPAVVGGLAGLALVVGTIGLVGPLRSGGDDIYYLGSPTIAAVRTIPTDTPIYANDPRPLLLRLDRSSLPPPDTTAGSDHDERQVAAVVADLRRRGGGVVVVFDVEEGRHLLPPEAAFRASPALEVLDDTADGIVFRLRPGA